MPKNFEVSGPAFLGIYVRGLATGANFCEKELGFRRETKVNA
jgi:hypothetical protein